MRESRTYGSVRGAPSDGRPYRDLISSIVLRSASTSCINNKQKFRHLLQRHDGEAVELDEEREIDCRLTRAQRVKRSGVM